MGARRRPKHVAESHLKNPFPTTAESAREAVEGAQNPRMPRQAAIVSDPSLTLSSVKVYE